MLSGCIPIVLGAAVIGVGLSSTPKPIPTVPRERDFFVSGRAIAMSELNCEKVNPIRMDKELYAVEGCGSRATMLLVEQPTVHWLRVGGIEQLPLVVVPHSEGVGRCDSEQVSDLMRAGVSGSAIESACSDP